MGVGGRVPVLVFAARWVREHIVFGLFGGGGEVLGLIGGGGGGAGLLVLHGAFPVVAGEPEDRVAGDAEKGSEHEKGDKELCRE